MNKYPGLWNVFVKLYKHFLFSPLHLDKSYDREYVSDLTALLEAFHHNSNLDDYINDFPIFKPEV